MNNDGYLDVVISSGSYGQSGAVLVWFPGTQYNVKITSTVGDSLRVFTQTTPRVLLDVDGNGLNDFVFTTTAGIKYIRNVDPDTPLSGDQVLLWEYSQTNPNYDLISSLKIGDLDGDDLLDITYSSRNDVPGIDLNRVGWLKNHGNGSFSR